MRLTLEFTDAGGRARKLAVERAGSAKVGRSHEADLSIPDDPMLSREHFAIEWAGADIRVRDLGSSNGTTLNGRKVDGSAPLKEGDLIQAGRTTFRVVVAESPPAEPPRRKNSGWKLATVSSEGMRREPSAPAGPAISPAGAEAPAIDPEAPPLEAAATPAPSNPTTGRPSAAAAALSPDQFVVQTMMWEGFEGVPRLTVIVKITCSMPTKHGAVASIAPEQLPIFSADIPWEDESIRTVRFECDVVPFKPRADVVVVGAAYFPRGKDPDTPLGIGVRVGHLDRTIHVYGDRVWRFPSRLAIFPEMGKPAPFERMDVVYDRAFGGIDESAALYASANLAGRGFAGKKTPESLDGKPLPNIEDPEDPIRTWSSHPGPVGFGFYGRGWSPRLAMAGTPSPAPEGRERQVGLPADFDYRFFNGAHPDLQVAGYLRGDEEVELRNMSPDSDFQFRLPALRPRVAVTLWESPPDEWLEARLREGRAATIEEVPTRVERLDPVLDTLVLVPDEGICYLVYRGQVRLRDLESLQVADVAVTVETPRSAPEKSSVMRTWIPRAGS
ncbi:DUF2169 domain-containing protein [Aquisphaera insulae]|uniref:DUF2169 domain-containing protein n=1 Tax=Aquisphaera insulae TaxID=2712864 RepID=UPI0013EB79CC|nr:DUF2169 domain-containing protein [Aquisphaera insulae]